MPSHPKAANMLVICLGNRNRGMCLIDHVLGLQTQVADTNKSESGHKNHESYFFVRADREAFDVCIQAHL